MFFEALNNTSGLSHEKCVCGSRGCVLGWLGWGGCGVSAVSVGGGEEGRGGRWGGVWC